MNLVVLPDKSGVPVTMCSQQPERHIHMAGPQFLNGFKTAFIYSLCSSVLVKSSYCVSIKQTRFHFA